MRSHRLGVAAAALAAAVLAAGCGAGRQSPQFGADAASPSGRAVPAAPVTQPPPVVVAGPDRKLIAERDAAAAAAARSEQAADRAEQQRRAARRRLREERRQAAGARRRAAAREALLRRALAARREAAGAGAGAGTPSGPSAPIAASDVTGSSLAADRDRRSDAESRAAVVRFHELLNARDARACDMLTPRLLEAINGSAPGALDRCRAGVRAITAPVSVVIAESRARGNRAVIAAVSRMGDREAAQTLRLVLVDGTWMIDAVERQSPR